MRPGATRTRCSASPTDRATGRRYGSSTGWGTRQCAGRSTRGGGWGSPARARAARCSACCATSCRARSCSCTSARRATAARSTRRRCRRSSGSCARAATGSLRWRGYELREAPGCARPSRARFTQRVEHDWVDPRDAVHALLEVRRTRPVEERLLQVAGVPEAREALAELGLQAVVVVDPVLRRRRAEDLLVQREKPPQLGDRPLV